MSKLTLTVELPYEAAVAIADALARDQIKVDAEMRRFDLRDQTDRSREAWQAALDLFAGDGVGAMTAADPDAYARGFEAGALSGDASEIGLICYQLGRKEERERCEWEAKRMADQMSDPNWTLACHALADKIRGKK